MLPDSFTAHRQRRLARLQLVSDVEFALRALVLLVLAGVALAVEWLLD